MAEFKISIDLAGVVDTVRMLIHEELFPKTSQAVQAIAYQAQEEWKQDVLKARLWSTEKTDYINSIQVKMTGAYSAVVWSDYKFAEEIETGRPAKDLKKMLNTSLKVRKTKDGRRYLIIPFRHNTPGNTALANDMPADVHKIVSSKNFKKSTVTGMGTRLSGTGAMGITSRKMLTVKQASYKWGDRLENGLTEKLKPFHSNAPTDGMVRMQTKSGKQNSSSYMTFRNMIEGSPKWIVPAKPGLFIAKKVAERLAPLADKVIKEAVKKDFGF
jgi:hypothetical protein